MTITDETPAAILPAAHPERAAATRTATPAPAADRRVWRDAEPRTAIGALLHTEVGHRGVCYLDRALWAAGVSVPLGAGAAVTYTVAPHLRHDGFAQALGHWAQVSPATAVAALLACALLCVAVVLGDHLRWHRGEAPHAGNEVHPLRDTRP